MAGGGECKQPHTASAQSWIGNWTGRVLCLYVYMHRMYVFLFTFLVMHPCLCSNKQEISTSFVVSFIPKSIPCKFTSNACYQNLYTRFTFHYELLLRISKLGEWWETITAISTIIVSGLPQLVYYNDGLIYFFWSLQKNINISNGYILIRKK